jgi:hypothetical protein
MDSARTETSLGDVGVTDADRESAARRMQQRVAEERAKKGTKS